MVMASFEIPIASLAESDFDLIPEINYTSCLISDTFYCKKITLLLGLW